MEDERQEAEFWLRVGVPRMTFTALRRRTRVDLRLTGNAYWEVRRNDLGQPRTVNHPRGICRGDPQGDPVEVSVLVHRTPITISEVQQTRRFPALRADQRGRTVF